jgi:hypothetical protein
MATLLDLTTSHLDNKKTAYSAERHPDGRVFLDVNPWDIPLRVSFSVAFIEEENQIVLHAVREETIPEDDAASVLEYLNAASEETVFVKPFLEDDRVQFKAMLSLGTQRDPSLLDLLDVFWAEGLMVSMGVKYVLDGTMFGKDAIQRVRVLLTNAGRL